MSKSFKGIETVKKIVAEASSETGIEMNVRTVSCEPSHYAPGQFPVVRTLWEEELIRLFDAYAPERDNRWREYGQDFENAVFRVRYDRQDGECSCGFEGLADKWHKENPHLPTCYCEIRSVAIAKWEVDHGMKEAEEASRCDIVTSEAIGFGICTTASRSAAAQEAHGRWCALFDARKKYEYGLSHQLCLEMGIPWNRGGGSAVHCTCGADEKAKGWFAKHDHTEPCDIWWMGQPNFLHKPSSYGVYWYKYPCREAYGTQQLQVDGFRAIIDECIASLVKPSPDSASPADTSLGPDLPSQRAGRK
jgi:hypothetical protein